jgi:hypothetical protein
MVTTERSTKSKKKQKALKNKFNSQMHKKGKWRPKAVKEEEVKN